MKNLFVISLLLVLGLNGFGQGPSKNAVIRSYSEGKKVTDLIDTKAYNELKKRLDDSTEINLLSKMESIDVDDENIEIVADIYYRQDIKKFIFTYYCGKRVSDGSEWGLFDYYFVLHMLIEYDEEGDTSNVTRATFLNTDTNLKEWWQHHMNSYNQKIYLRKAFADRYGLFPPPPPPPETKAWFKK